MTNFFQAGGGLPENYPAYTPRYNLDDDAFNAALNGELLHVIAPRQFGKTSLLRRLRARLVEKGWRCVIVDLSTLLNFSMVSWYSELGNQLAVELTPEMPLTLTNHLNMSTYLTSEAIQENYGIPRIAIFFDEVESVIRVHDEQGQPFSDSFFMTIRDLYQRRDTRKGLITIGLAGAVSAAHLVKDSSISPFNIGQPLNIADFTQNETRAFTKYLDKLNVKVDDAVHEEIYLWTNGHPYLTHRICAELERMVDSKPLTAITVDNVRYVVECIFLQPPNPLLIDTNIRHATKMLKDLPVPALPLWKDIHQGIITSRRSVDTETFTDLYMTGVIKSQDGHLIIRNRIYEEVFTVKKITEQTIGMNNKTHQASDIAITEQRVEKLERNPDFNEPMPIDKNITMSEKKIKQVKKENKDESSVSPWKSGSFYLVAAVTIIATLCLAASLMPWYYFPIAIIGTVIVISVIGAFQLLQDNRMKEKTFLELMRLSLKSLFLLRQHDVKSENIDK